MKSNSATSHSGKSLLSRLFRIGVLVFAVIASPTFELVDAQTPQTAAIVGQVTDSTGSPMAMVGVMLIVGGSAPRPAVTSTDGRFRFNNVPVGPHQLRFSTVGYSASTLNVTVKAGADNKADVRLTSSGVSLLSVVGVGAPRSAWMGAKVAVPVSGGTADDFQAQAITKLEVLGKESHRFSTYVMGNIARFNTNPANADEEKARDAKLREVQQSGQGVTVAIVPHVFWGDATENSITLFLPFGYKVNVLKDTLGTKDVYLNQLRFGMGAAFTFWKGKYSKLPVEVVVGPSFSLLSKSDYASVFRDSRSYVGTFDAQVIVPLGEGVGVLAEYSSPIAGKSKSIFRAGLALNATRPRD